MPAALERLARPLGGWLGVLVWRLFGLVLVTVWSQNVRPTWAAGLARTPPGFDALALAGVLLALLGPSLVVLGLTCAASLWFLYELLVAGSIEFLADEYIVHTGVPIVGFVLALAAVVQQRRAPLAELHAFVELAQLRLFRVVSATTLALAGLHKLNAGFFDPEATCAKLGERLSQWWVLPDISGGPLAIVALELACPIALICYPRLGLGLVVLTMAAMAHIGPAGFATTVVVLSLAFLSPADHRGVRLLMQRHGLQLALATAFVLMLSFARYAGPNPWFRYGVFEAVGFVVLVITTQLGLTRVRRRLLRRGMVGLWQPACSTWRRWSARMPWPGLTSWLLVLTLANGMSPYLGFKYRLSVAMLSNLRVDDGQWNSYVIPAWFDLRPHDGFIHVDWEPASPKHDLIEDGAYQHDRFMQQFDNAMQAGARGSLGLSFRGETTYFELPGAYLEVRAWAEGKPQSRMFQEQLTAPWVPQHCTH